MSQSEKPESLLHNPPALRWADLPKYSENALDCPLPMSLLRLLGNVRSTAVTSLCVGSLVFILPGILGHLERPSTSSAKNQIVQGGTRFAIADFDGDSQPDTATIRVAWDSSPSAEYLLELRLSSGSRPSIGILGPAGGLRVTPQDVNGDKIADLVVTSAFDAHFVAILLNDGKGNFRRVASSDFPNVGRNPEPHVLSSEDSGQFQLTLGEKRSTDDREAPGSSSEGSLAKGTQLVGSVTAVIRNAQVHACASRAPPLAYCLLNTP